MAKRNQNTATYTPPLKVISGGKSNKTLKPYGTARAVAASIVSDELPVFITRDEANKAIAWASERRAIEGAFLRVLWTSGARISEALALTPLDVDYDNCVLRLVTRKRRRRRPGRTKKGADPLRPSRAVPVPPATLSAVAVVTADEHTRQRDRIFWWSRSRGYELVRAALLAAGVERGRARPHALRHGWAVNAVRQGVPINIVQRALGHASVSTTTIYLDVTAAEAAKHLQPVKW